LSKSVALVSAVDPYPAETGRRVVLAGFLEYLIDRLGAHNVHYVQIGGPEMPGFPAQLHRIPKPSSFAALQNIVIRTGTARSSMQESMLHSRRLRKAIHDTLDRISPALEIYDTNRMAQRSYRCTGHLRFVCSRANPATGRARVRSAISTPP
jgi:hypothetical protein